MAHSPRTPDSLEVLSSGGFAAAPVLDDLSGSLCAMSVTEDASNSTVVPFFSGSSNVLSAPPVPERMASADLPAAAADARRRLFFAQASPECSEADLRAWFGRHGDVESLQLLSDATGGPSSSCGYVTLSTHEAAAAALAAAQQQPRQGGPVGYLALSWAASPDGPAGGGPCAAAAPAGAPPASAPPPPPVLTSSSSSVAALRSPTATLMANADRTVFFAKVPPTALAGEVELLFGSFGTLSEVNLFKAWAGAKHSKGCGLVTYADRASAAGAIAQLHGKFTFPGSDCPMVVEWLDMKKQRPVAPTPPADKPPAGCSYDAYKLLLANVPATMPEGDLRAALSQFGLVVSLALAADPCGASASGHVWFSTRAAADALLQRAKAEPLWLRDARSQQDLALSVKRARRAASSAGGSSAGRAPPSAAQLGGAGGNSAALPMLHYTPVFAGAPGSGDFSGALPQLQLPARFAAGQQQQQHVPQHASAADLSLVAQGVIHLLPMHAAASSPGYVAQQLHGAGGAHAAAGAGGGGYMAIDVCEALLDHTGAFDGGSMGLSLPVHLAPAIAAQQMAGSMGPYGRAAANSQIGLLQSPGGQLHTSGAHCLSSPANLASGLDDVEGSFSLPLMRGVSNASSSSTHLQGGMPVSSAMGWHPQAQQLQHHPQHQHQVVPVMALHQQQPQPAARAHHGAGGGAHKSIVVPIESYEVHGVAEQLVFFSGRSGARVTITSLPGAPLAIMMSGRPEQVAMAQSLLAAARGRAA